MPRKGYSGKSIKDFAGPTRGALAARNIRYEFQEGSNPTYPTCKVRTREGHAAKFDPLTVGPIHSMYNFIATDPDTSTAINRVPFFTGTDLRVYDVLTGSRSQTNPPTNVTALKASIDQAGTRFYVAFYDVNGIGVAQGRVVDSADQAENLFQAPPVDNVAIFSAAEYMAGGAGLVTKGPHKVAFVAHARTGFDTRPAPINHTTGAFAPVSVTATGGWKVQVSLSGLPANFSNVAVLMTTSTDLAKYYFVPGATFGGGSVIVDISDADLELGQAADNYFNLLTIDPLTGLGPINPSFVCAYKNRMVYGAGDRVYISDPFNYQSITADQHVQFLPGLRNIKTACPYRDGSLYLIGDDWTYAIADNGDVPTAWPGPQLVDGAIGTVCVSGLNRQPSQNVVPIATTGGLRLFSNGAYQDPPLSFWTPDWARINWAVGQLIEVIDDTEEQCIRVLVPLDTAITPSHEMVFDYKRGGMGIAGVQSGRTPDSIRYSLNALSGRYCFCLVESSPSTKRELWLGPSSGAGSVPQRSVWRRDNALSQDVGVDIADQVYETKLILDIAQLGGPSAFHGVYYTATGTAQLQVIAYAQKHQRQTDPKITDLTLVPAGQRVHRQWLMNAENESLEFSAQSGWFELVECEPEFTQWITQR